MSRVFSWQNTDFIAVEFPPCYLLEQCYITCAEVGVGVSFEAVVDSVVVHETVRDESVDGDVEKACVVFSIFGVSLPVVVWLITGMVDRVSESDFVVKLSVVEIISSGISEVESLINTIGSVIIKVRAIPIPNIQISLNLSQ